MKSYVLALATLCCNESAQAYSNFISNPNTQYPPGCANSPYPPSENNRKTFYEGTVALTDPRDADRPVNTRLVASRAACADPNRSMILFHFSEVEEPIGRVLQIPLVRARLDGDEEYWMSLARETNTWQVGIEPWAAPQWYLATDCSWGCYDRDVTFILDAAPPESENPWQLPALSAADYNGNFQLVLTDAAEQEVIIDVPSTGSMFESSSLLPLSGRLSGNWVVDGAADQGFLLSVSELVGTELATVWEQQESPLLMFLSWYTYDANGELLWLTGAARFEQGDTEVVVPIERVMNGEFLGTKPADRAVVGSVTITGNHCNDLGFEYELTAIGLGSGNTHLERPFSLETAGYACRDLEARIAEKGN